MICFISNIFHNANCNFNIFSNDLFRYGRIKDIDLKTPARPPAFAFITFDDSRDAEDAVRGRDGYSFDGYRLRCEFAKGERRGLACNQIYICINSHKDEIIL